MGCLHRVVYLDTLFFFNLCMDYVLLTGVRLMTGERRAVLRQLAAAVIGGAMAVAAALWGGGAVIRLAGAPVMAAAAFGWGGRARLLRLTAALLALSAALGGCVFALYYLFGDGADFALYGGAAYVNITPFAFALSLPAAACLTWVAARVFSSGALSGRQIAEVELVLLGKRFSGRGLIDTGAALCEPISGRQAIVVQRSLVAPACPVRPEAGEKGVRMVPFTTVSGQGFLPALRCDVSVALKGRSVVHRGLYAALSEQPLSSDGSYQIILGHTILVAALEGELFNDRQKLM